MIGNPIPFTQTPTPTPATDWPGNLRDVIDTQQQTIKFLLSQWDDMLAQTGISGAFGEPQALAVDVMIPTGWWQTTSPPAAGVAIGSVEIAGNSVNIYSGVFWSDGKVKVTFTGGITIVRIAQFEPATPTP